MSASTNDKTTGGSKKRRQQDETSEFPRKLPRLDESASFSNEESRDEQPTRSVARHTKKERKQNRSTRIHSLRKLLARGKLPSNVQQEKERELASLIHDQDKTKSKKEAKRTLERYHYVRFVERQKAEKRLKRLRKAQVSGGSSTELDEKIHEMEVNRCYAIYHPLDQKYISIFASSTNEEEEDDKDQDIIESRIEKPPMWYTVEAAMARGEKSLQALRIGKSNSNTDHITIHPDRAGNFVVGNTVNDVPGSKLGSKKRANQTKLSNGTRRTAKQKMEEEQEEEEEESDGGFFDR